MIETDVFISGAGLAGSIAALSYAKAGRKVTVADPFIDSDNNQKDYRTTAYLQPSKLLLERLGIWETIEDIAMPLEVMKIIDSSSDENRSNIKSQKEFKSTEISDLPFGWNVKNSLMRASLKSLIDSQSNCELISDSSAIDLVCRRFDSLRETFFWQYSKSKTGYRSRRKKLYSQRKSWYFSKNP